MRKRIAACVLAASLMAQAAWAQSWILGSHIGLVGIHSGEGNSGSTTVVSWPSNTLAYQPSLRLGIATESHAHELAVDSGLLLIDEAGSTLSELATNVTYQYAFRASAPLNPYANVALGFYREGGAAAVSTSLAYGAGLGIRHVVSERHGCLRAEVRLDRLEADTKIGRPYLTLYGLRLGFDLWL